MTKSAGRLNREAMTKSAGRLNREAMTKSAGRLLFASEFLAEGSLVEGF